MATTANSFQILIDRIIHTSIYKPNDLEPINTGRLIRLILWPWGQTQQRRLMVEYSDTPQKILLIRNKRQVKV